MQLGRVGLWAFQLDLLPAPAARDTAAELESLGYPTLWVPEAVNRDPMVNSMLLLGATERLVLATGIASIWSRDAMAMQAAHLGISEAHPDRFLLGLGVSHQPMVDFVKGHQYDKPLSKMSAYLDAMDAAIYVSPRPEAPQRVLAALGPKMLALAAEKAQGAHPYFVPVEHTPRAREALGAGPLLCPEQAVVLDTDPESARAAARLHMATYLTLPNYTNNLRRLGWDDEDLDGGGSDELVDAIVAWGDEDAIVARVQAHLDAGADHVAVQVLDAAPTTLPLPQWRTLAPALLSL
ncbi:MAG TPA: LLM class F420-dependent oxidoreductase [Acidimicrobiales bacterium]|nr:LLM class F420-dependent oxidoreductase [Acidimicrobiales bacterium]